MSDIFALIAERRIREAMERGEFDQLALRGQPLRRDAAADVPEELRMGYKLLHNAGFLPEELELRREILTLGELLDCCSNPEERERLKKRLTLKNLHYSVLMEKNRRNPAFLQYNEALEKKLLP